MIKKEKAKKLGIKIRDQNDLMGEKNKELIKKLKSLLPNIINSDGTLNTEALQDAIDTSHTTSKKNQGYELTFAGKWVARWIAGSPTKKELKTEKEESKNFETTRNVLIRGDNLDVLKILYQNYHNKIKMIYIDPPYNTKSDEFIYKDDFKKSEQELIEECGIEEEEIDFLQNIYGTKTHSGWLSFMYPRLKLARDLLKEDGVIFISIDDNEQANLKIICDEIFGNDNTDSFIWRKSGDGRDGKMKNTQTIRKDHEYIIFAFKDIKKLNKSLEKPNWINKYTNPDNDPRGNYKAGSISRKKEASNENSKNFYSVTSPSGKVFTRQFDIPKKEFENLNNDNRIYWGINGNAVPAIKIFENEKRKTNTSSLILNNGTTTDGTNYLNDIFETKKMGEEIRPKPCQLLSKIIQISTKTDKDEVDIILDFFAGSGTTGDAVMRLNAEDGGNRKFILVQWDEEINPKKNKEAHNFCKDNNLQPVISSICLERLNRAGEKIKREHQTKRGMFPSSEGLDIGYKVFSLKKKPKIGGEDEIFKLKNERQSTLDTLFNMLSTTGKTLDTPIQEIQKDVLYGCDGEIYLIAKTNPERLENYRNHKVNIDGYAEIDLESFLNMEVATRENINIIY